MTIFNEGRLEDVASYENPTAYPTGIDYVLVNGQLVIDQGRHTGAKPGQGSEGRRLRLKHGAPVAVSAHPVADVNGSSWFQRYLLPGFAFKAVVIGGGYATGRELAEFFLPSGPRGGLLAIFLAMLIWSVVCAVTFSLAYATKSWNYRDLLQESARAVLGDF